MIVEFRDATAEAGADPRAWRHALQCGGDGVAAPLEQRQRVRAPDDEAVDDGARFRQFRYVFLRQCAHLGLAE